MPRGDGTGPGGQGPVGRGLGQGGGGRNGCGRDGSGGGSSRKGSRGGGGACRRGGGARGNQTTPIRSARQPRIGRKSQVPIETLNDDERDS
jgi:hypothetical protein